MKADQLLQAIGGACGLNGLQFDNHGCARLMIDGALPVQLEYNEAEARLYLYSELGSIPPAGRETLFREMLEANLFGHDTSGATLALDPEYNDIVLWQAVPIDYAVPEEMPELLERFIGVAETWLNRLKRPAEPETTGLSEEGHMQEIAGLRV